ncbi:MAG: hypothetical protein JKY26_16480 [Pseudomonas sp.]|uniref:hypothetical protein n=1 Tax=Halopseudomonas sp. TaxID=2901191 RepID=UPI001A5105BC|nr:hypothetical protein [Pseudomonas sp.]|tara:strand:+ start:2560 stop:3174 length:615 start_codon:yes stop_codon:yes gene_type:complete
MKSEVDIVRGKRPALQLVNTSKIGMEGWLRTNNLLPGRQDAASDTHRDSSRSVLALWLEKAGRPAAAPPDNQNDEPTPYLLENHSGARCGCPVHHEEALHHLYPVAKPRTVDLGRNPTLNMAYVELKALKQTILKHQKREALLTQQLQDAMGTASRAIFAGGEITWIQSRDTAVLDIDQLLKDKPHLKARYTRMEEGDREFLIT